MSVLVEKREKKGYLGGRTMSGTRKTRKEEKDSRPDLGKKRE